MAIFTHVTVGTNDLAKARAFYDGVLGALGCKRLTDLGDNGSIWGESAPEFFVLKAGQWKTCDVRQWRHDQLCGTESRGGGRLP
jgi:catechol 2,3-dioxygenase-like lactoylglutathione lyase family enzyme